MLAKISLAVVVIACILGAVVQFRHVRFVPNPHQDAPPNRRVAEVPEDRSATDPRPTLDEQCVERSRQLRWQLDADYAVSVHSPFVLAGDLGVDLGHQYDTVVQPACEVLNRRFCDQPPNRPLRILLFSDEATYRLNAERLFFDRDVSRFGYFKPGRRVVLVNLAEGPGALRHELVHALMHFDFPDAPPWLQEGLATLYEAVACSEDAAGLHWEPVPNWRLTVLQRELNAAGELDLRRLMGASDLGGQGEAAAYAQARYLCMYLHRLGHLESVYRCMRENVQRDPSGERTLMAAFPECSWSELESQFCGWVLSLVL